MSASGADWLQAPAQEKGLAGYVQTLRERFWLILLAVVVTTGASILYVATASKTYEAEADILVTPVPQQSDLLSSLGLIQQSADPVREIETVARFIDTNEVAAEAQKELGGHPGGGGQPPEPARPHQRRAGRRQQHRRGDRQRIDRRSTPPRWPTCSSTRRSATGRPSSMTASRRSARGIDAQLKQNPPDARSLEAQLSQLKRLQNSPDPTVQAATKAVPPGLALVAEAGAQHRRWAAGRLGAGHRGRLRLPGARSAAEP